MRPRRLQPLRVLAVTTSALALGCSSKGNQAAAATDAGTTADAGPNGMQLPPGDTTVSLVDDAGAMRSYLVHVPATYDAGSSVPLVVLFHGLGGSAALAASYGMSATADSSGFVVAYPQGNVNSTPIGPSASFNTGQCCGSLDDVAFARRVVTDVSSKVRIDPSRVYAAGFSNGAIFTQRLACEAPDLFAAFAPVSGPMDPTLPCTPSRPVALIEFHGTGDHVVPYDGGTVNLMYLPDAGPVVLPSVPDTFAGWAARDGCTGSPAETFRNNSAHCSTYASCNGGVKVTLCTIDGGGHCWPGAPTCTMDINADDQIWQFLDAFTRP